MTRMLVIDDDYDAQNPDPLWDLLRTKGFIPTFATTVPGAKNLLRKTAYDLVVSDVMLAEDAKNKVTPGSQAVPSGIQLCRDIRGSLYVRPVPLVVLTHYEQWAKRFNVDADDPYTTLIDRNANGAQTLRDLICAHVMKCTAHGRQVAAALHQSDGADDRDWPNKHPMYVSEGNIRVRVHFQPITPAEVTAILEASAEDPWLLGAEFRGKLNSPGKFYKLAGLENIRHEPIGLLYIGEDGSDTPWRYTVLFETAPRLRWHGNVRLCKDCGSVLVARVIFECLQRRELTVYKLVNGPAHLESDDTSIRAIHMGKPFLTKLKYDTVAEGSPLMTATTACCREIVERVRKPY